MKKQFKIFTALILFIFACQVNQKIQPIVHSRILMGTIVQITVYQNIPNLDQIVEKAFQSIEEVNVVASNYIDSSKISIINREASNRFIEIDTLLYDILKKAHYVSEISTGAFDITISPLLKLWNYHDPNPKVPIASDIQNALKFVNYQNIMIKDQSIKFKTAGMKIDLGGIAKGYAVDKAMDVLIKHGITDALIDAGGDFRTICSDFTKGKRKVWVKHPRQQDRLFGYFYMDNGSVATSGDYERFFEIDSVRYHHIIDPHTGYPANKCASVTIYANSAMLADAFATAVFVLGPEKGMKLINQTDNIEGIIIFEKQGNLEYIVSENLSGKFFINE